MKTMNHLRYLFLVVGWATMLSCTSSPNTFNVQNFGAKGIKDQKVTKQIQKAIDKCHEEGGGQVYFPPGEYVTGTVVLKDNVTVHLEAGATLYSSRDTNDFDTDFKVIKQNDSGKEGKGITPVLIYAKGAENIGITGQGTIHGQAERTYEEMRKVDGFIDEIIDNARKAGVEMKRWYKIKPFVSMIFLESCKDITIKDIELVESCDWTLHFKWCEQAYIDNISIFSSLEKGINADGIDIDGSKDIVVNNSIIKTGDDAIVMKTTETFGESKSCENITISNCDLASTSSAIKLGTESHADFNHIICNNCVIRNSNRGLGIIVRDGGTAKNIQFSNITMELDRKHFNWWGNADPIWLVLLKRHAQSELGAIKNVSFNNIIAHGQGTSKLEGYHTDSIVRPLKNIQFNHVQFFMDPEDYADKRSKHAFLAHDIHDLKLFDVDINWNEKDIQKKWHDGLVFKNVNQLRVDKVNGKQAPTNKGVFMYMNQVQNAIVERCYAEEGTNVFLRATGDETQNIYLNDNYLMNAEQDVKKGQNLSGDDIIIK